MAKIKDNTTDQTESTKENIEIVPVVTDSEKAIIKSPETDLESFYKEDGQDDNLDYIPSLKIAQKGEFLGQLYCPDMEQAWPEMEVALLRVTNSRVLWPEEFNKENLPLCRSQDGLTPSCDIPEDSEAEEENIKFLPPMAIKCKDCPYSKWSGKNKPPRCMDVRDLLLIDLNTSIPFFYSVYSIALSPFNQKLKKPLMMRKMSLTAQRKRKGESPGHISMFSFNLGTELDSRASGDSYKPIFNNISELDDEMKFFTGTVAMQLRGYSKNVELKQDTPEEIDNDDDDF